VGRLLCYEFFYLDFRERFDTLKWLLSEALISQTVSTEQVALRETQRNWMRQFLAGLSTPDLRDRYYQQQEFERLLADPLSVFFEQPLTDEQFAAFQARVQQNLRANWASHRLWHATLEQQLPDRLRSHPSGYRDWIAFDYGWRFTDTFQPTLHRSGPLLMDVRSRGDVLDVVKQDTIQLGAPAKHSSLERWLRVQTTGDICFDSEAETLRGVRGAKLAPLNVSTWYAADRIRLAGLRQVLAKRGRSSISLKDFSQDAPGAASGRQANRNAPLVLVQTKDGHVCVMKIEMWFPGGFMLAMDPQSRRGPFVIALHVRPRPLSPNPPLHPGDAPETK
jgi:hypothetical protein